MSADQRSLARLPIHIFSDLKQDGSNDPQALKMYITSTLKTEANISIVGDLLEVTPLIIMRILDVGINRSIKLSLTYRECQLFIKRVCQFCSVVPYSSLVFLRQTTITSTMNLHERENDKEHSLIMRHVSTGMEKLDEYLKGGLRVGTITEIVGRAGVGKTQLAMQLCCELGGRFQQGSVFIDTEQKLSLRRLQEMATCRYHNCLASSRSNNEMCYEDDQGLFSYDDDDLNDIPDQDRNIINSTSTKWKENEKNEYSNPNQVMENITIHRPKTMEELLETLSAVELDILQRNESASKSKRAASHPRADGIRNNGYFPVRLAVIDSIAAPLRYEVGDPVHNVAKNCTPMSSQRLSVLFHTSKILKRMAHQLQIAILVVNQVDHIGDDYAGCDTFIGMRRRSELSSGSDFVAVTASLGQTWQHCPTTRIFLEHERDPHREESQIDVIVDNAGMLQHEVDDVNKEVWMNNRGRVRTATVIKSNVATFASMKYDISASGLSQINP